MLLSSMAVAPRLFFKHPAEAPAKLSCRGLTCDSLAPAEKDASFSLFILYADILNE